MTLDPILMVFDQMAFWHNALLGVMFGTATALAAMTLALVGKKLS